MSLVSICIPAYKAERFIKEALDSVRVQTFTDWEVIVTEDGSTDRTPDIVRDFASTVSQNVILNRHEKNRGLSATRNTGIRAATGEWIAFLDSDDIWKPTHLADLVAATASVPDCTIAYAGCLIFDDITRATLETRAPSPEDLARFPTSLYNGSFIIQPSAVLIHRSAFDRYGFVSEAYPICNDMELWLRVASGGGRFAYTGNITCLYRKHGEAMSLKSAALIEETARICASHGQWQAIPSSLRQQRPADLYRYAGQILLRENPRHARDLFKHSLHHMTWQPRTFALWCAASLLAPFKTKSA